MASSRKRLADRVGAATTRGQDHIAVLYFVAMEQDEGPEPR
jgi:hypothetical protein